MFIMHSENKIGAVIQSQVGFEFQRLFNAPVEFFHIHSVPCKNAYPFVSKCRCDIVLCRKRIAAAPTHFGSRLNECFHKHSRFFCYVQTSGNFVSFKTVLFCNISPASAMSTGIRDSAHSIRSLPAFASERSFT